MIIFLAEIQRIHSNISSDGYLPIKVATKKAKGQGVKATRAGLFTTNFIPAWWICMNILFMPSQQTSCFTFSG